MKDRLQKLQELESIRLKLGLNDQQFEILKENFLLEDQPVPKGVPLGDYTLIERLGEGVLGKVYKALSPTEDIVCVKVLRPELMTEPYIDRFLQKTETMIIQSHPNLVNVTNTMSSPAIAMIMDYIDGAPFSANDEPVPIPAVEYIVQEILTGLDYWHGQGLFHGDLKPSNIILSRHGKVFILDYGMYIIY